MKTRLGTAGFLACVVVSVFALCGTAYGAEVKLITAKTATARELYGAERLRAALAGLKTAPAGARVVAGVRSAPDVERFGVPEFWPQAQEAFLIKQVGKIWVVTGSDASGVLYGEMELAARIKADGALPEGIDDTEHPALKLRGACIGMQKPEYDAVALQSDVEIGATEQKFNLLVHRDIQREYAQPSEVAVTMPILVGLDGARKMSKSLGNYIGITEAPGEMFGKVMSISDELMWSYYELLTDFTEPVIVRLREEVRTGVLHPKKAKVQLAHTIVAGFHGEDAARKAGG